MVNRNFSFVPNSLLVSLEGSNGKVWRVRAEGKAYPGDTKQPCLGGDAKLEILDGIDPHVAVLKGKISIGLPLAAMTEAAAWSLISNALRSGSAPELQMRVSPDFYSELESEVSSIKTWSWDVAAFGEDDD
jgi:hypothetical protein